MRLVQVQFELTWRDYYRYFTMKHGNGIFLEYGTKGRDVRWRNDPQVIFDHFAHLVQPTPVSPPASALPKCLSRVQHPGQRCASRPPQHFSCDLSLVLYMLRGLPRLSHRQQCAAAMAAGLQLVGLHQPALRSIAACSAARAAPL